MGGGHERCSNSRGLCGMSARASLRVALRKTLVQFTELVFFCCIVMSSLRRPC